MPGVLRAKIIRYGIADKVVRIVGPYAINCNAVIEIVDGPAYDLTVRIVGPYAIPAAYDWNVRVVNPEALPEEYR